jgi:hypothetical protein
MKWDQRSIRRTWKSRVWDRRLPDGILVRNGLKIT